MNEETARDYDNRYCRLRDMQFAAYELYARKHGLTARELFVLDILWFSPEGRLQSDICERLSATKQTISGIVKKFWQIGYLSLTESNQDRRNKIVRFTPEGYAYAEKIIPPAAEAEVQAMAELTEQEMETLLWLTTRFSESMKQRFDKIREEE